MTPNTVTIAEAADVLGLPVSGVEALVGAGYLPLDDASGLRLSDLKSFQARNAAARGQSIDEVVAQMAGVDAGAEEILDALEASIDDMARRAADLVGSVFPEAAAWNAVQRLRFEAQAAQRFEAIVAVTRSAGADDADLLDDLARAGSAAAFDGAPLPQVLLTFRISRDLLVQAAVRAAEELGREWGLALAVVLTQVLPVLDRLADSVTRGYWSAVITREHEAFSRFEHVVEHSANGVYEVDLTGCLRYVNPAMARLCRRSIDDLIGRPIIDVLRPVDPNCAGDTFWAPTLQRWRRVEIDGDGGTPRVLALQITARTREGEIIGFDGVVRDLNESEQTLLG